MAAKMSKSRLEAFSDGVLAIIITIMVLELKVPHGVEFSTLQPLWPAFISYLLSFIYVGIYWNNHHHMLHAAKHINGVVLWANLHLLFWLSLIPFVTGWMGENHFAPLPTAFYGLILLMSAVAYSILQFTIMKADSVDSILVKAVGKDIKGKISPILYSAAIVLAFAHEAISLCLYALVAAMWFIPDARIEKAFGKEE